MCWSWMALVLLTTVLQCVFRIHCACVDTGSVMYGRGYSCSNMTRGAYDAAMRNISSNFKLRELKLIHIHLPTINRTLFPGNDNFMSYRRSWSSDQGYQFIYSLTIQQCGVTSIANDSFKALASLTHLYIYNNDIKYFKDDFIKPLTNLKILDMSSNNIQQFQINCNFYNRDLKELILNYNPIDILQKHAFGNCTYLTTLNITFAAHIEPEAFEGLYSIKDMDMKFIFRNNTTIKRNQFKGLSNLQTLNLTDLNIHSIESEAFTGLEAVQTIYLKYNNISFLQANTFKGLNNPKILNLEHIGLKTIYPNAFRGIKNLTELLLSLNSINIIHKGCFNGLKFLNHLNLSYSKVTYIESKAFNNLNSLVSLDLSSNNLSIFPSDIYEQNNSLTKLNLSHNRIENIDLYVFQNLSSLRTLLLQSNRISELSVGSLSGLRWLHYLDISYNKLATLSEAALLPLWRIRVINISGNCLTHLNVAPILNQLGFLYQIDLSDNPWNRGNLTGILDRYGYRLVYKNTGENFGRLKCMNNETNNVTNEIVTVKSYITEDDITDYSTEQYHKVSEVISYVTSDDVSDVNDINTEQYDDVTKVYPYKRQHNVTKENSHRREGDVTTIPFYVNFTKVRSSRSEQNVTKVYPYKWQYNVTKVYPYKRQTNVTEATPNRKNNNSSKTYTSTYRIHGTTQAYYLRRDYPYSRVYYRRGDYFGNDSYTKEQDVQIYPYRRKHNVTTGTPNVNVTKKYNYRRDHGVTTVTPYNNASKVDPYRRAGNASNATVFSRNDIINDTDYNSGVTVGNKELLKEILNSNKIMIEIQKNLNLNGNKSIANNNKTTERQLMNNVPLTSNDTRVEDINHNYTNKTMYDLLNIIINHIYSLFLYTLFVFVWYKILCFILEMCKIKYEYKMNKNQK